MLGFHRHRVNGRRRRWSAAPAPARPIIPAPRSPSQIHSSPEVPAGAIVIPPVATDTTGAGTFTGIVTVDGGDGGVGSPPGVVPVTVAVFDSFPDATSAAVVT